MSAFDTADLDILLGDDFADEVKATTWGTEFCGILDHEFAEFEDVSREATYLLVKTSDVPATADTGDLFTVCVDGVDVNYQLVDVQYAEPGLSRLVLGLV